MAVVEEGGGILRSRVHARIGLLGNTSDGFNGAVIAFSLANFHAEVRLWSKACAAGLQRQQVETIGELMAASEVALRHTRGPYRRRRPPASRNRLQPPAAARRSL